MEGSKIKKLFFDITLGFPSLVQIAVRFVFDTYIYEECSNVEGID
jgi:hypothetical protein